MQNVFILRELHNVWCANKVVDYEYVLVRREGEVLWELGISHKYTMSCIKVKVNREIIFSVLLFSFFYLCFRCEQALAQFGPCSQVPGGWWSGRCRFPSGWFARCFPESSGRLSPTGCSVWGSPWCDSAAEWSCRVLKSDWLAPGGWWAGRGQKVLKGTKKKKKKGTAVEYCHNEACGVRRLSDGTMEPLCVSLSCSFSSSPLPPQCKKAPPAGHSGAVGCTTALNKIHPLTSLHLFRQRRNKASLSACRNKIQL